MEIGPASDIERRHGMAVLAGIDEAGFGPLLGPLAVSGVAFRAVDGDVCLWDKLKRTCSRTPARNDPRLLIFDSKRLYRTPQDLALLERAVLVMLASGEGASRPATIADFLQRVSPRAPAMFREYPWYDELTRSLPLVSDTGDVPTRANALRRDMADAGIRFGGMFGELLPEGHFNRWVEATRNKSAVLLTLVMRVIRRIVAGAGDEPVHISVDRLGGRVHYREALATEFPLSELHVLEESDARSAYRLTTGESTWEVEFLTGGEERRFAVALAGIVSKYARELCMRLFNGYWARHQADLRPTAGYYTDGCRWLREVDGLLRRQGVDRNMLVRRR